MWLRTFFNVLFKLNQFKFFKMAYTVDMLRNRITKVEYVNFWLLSRKHLFTSNTELSTKFCFPTSVMIIYILSPHKRPWFVSLE